jgi:hypothetical protein
MKPRPAVLQQLAALFLLTFAVPASATGGPGTQGPRFAGQGLDKTEAVAGGGYQSTGVQTFDLPSSGFPPSAGQTFTPLTNPKNYSLGIVQCTSHPDFSQNVRLAVCTAVVNSNVLDNGKNVCGQPRNAAGTTELIAINAGWDVPKASLNFSVNSQVIFGCRDLGGIDLDDSAGAFGKCVHLGFYEKDDPDLRSQFLACIRATRGDFCSNGVSLTQSGTPYAVYRYPLQPQEENPDAGICTKDNCWEASWNQDGATCMNHRRYMELLYLASSGNEKLWTGLKAGEARQPLPSSLRVLQAEFVGDHVKGVIKAPGVGLEARKTYQLSPDLLNTLAKQNVLLQCPPSSPVLDCLKKFTTYYYDDTHLMWWMVDANPVDSVTAQVVCKPQYARNERSTLMTRTAVRFPLSDGGYETLPCCDTLGDCPRCDAGTCQ